MNLLWTMRYYCNFILLLSLPNHQSSRLTAFSVTLRLPKSYLKKVVYVAILEVYNVGFYCTTLAHHVFIYILLLPHARCVRTCILIPISQYTYYVTH